MLRERWMTFWFAPVPPLNLGVCRALFFGAFFLFYLPQDFARWGGLPGAFWAPVPPFEALGLPVPPPEALAWAGGIWKAALALGCLGLLTRASTAASFVLGFYLLGLPQNFVGGVPYHYDMLVVLALGILAFSRCGDGFSADHLIRDLRGKSSPGTRPCALRCESGRSVACGESSAPTATRLPRRSATDPTPESLRTTTTEVSP